MACAKKQDDYGGMKVMHSPKYHVIVKFKDEHVSKLRECTRDTKFVSRKANRSVTEQDAITAKAAEALSRQGVEFSYSTSFEYEAAVFNIVKSDSARSKSLLEALDVPKFSIRLEEADRVDIVQTAIWQGNNTYRNQGQPVCTTGFSVQSNTTGIKGITTAGHCTDWQPNTGSVQTPEFDPNASNATPNIDLQWNSNGSSGANSPYVPQMSYTNVVPGTFQNVLLALDSTTLPQGIFMCALGRGSSAPHERCGSTSGTFTGPINGVMHTFAKATQFGGNGTPNSFVQSGDSGGPVYLTIDINEFGLQIVGVLALGTIVGHPPNINDTVLYTPSELFSSLMGVTILETGF